MYLRKSRMDTDFEEVSVTETLSRHRTILENLCKNMKLNVVEVLEEVPVEQLEEALNLVLMNQR